MALDVRDIMLFVHVTSVVVWFSSIPIYLVIKRIITNLESREASVFSILAPIGYMVMTTQLLVFLTGGYLSGSNWFKFESGFLWLTLKQIFFLLLLGFSHGVLLRNNREVSKMVTEDASTEEISEKFSKTVKFSLVPAVIIVVNIFLATSKFI